MNKENLSRNHTKNNGLTLFFKPCPVNDVWPDSGFDSLVDHVWCEGDDWYQQYQEVEGRGGSHNLEQSSEISRYREPHGVEVRVDNEEKEPNTWN